jgi:hypothetical protein
MTTRTSKMISKRSKSNTKMTTRTNNMSSTRSKRNSRMTTRTSRMSSTGSKRNNTMMTRTSRMSSTKNSKWGAAIQSPRPLGSTFGTEARLGPQLIMKCNRSTNQNFVQNVSNTMRASKVNTTRSELISPTSTMIITREKINTTRI